jgi:hypothetical protein
MLGNTGQIQLEALQNTMPHPPKKGDITQVFRRRLLNIKRCPSIPGHSLTAPPINQHKVLCLAVSPMVSLAMALNERIHTLLIHHLSPPTHKREKRNELHKLATVAGL